MASQVTRSRAALAASAGGRHVIKAGMRAHAAASWPVDADLRNGKGPGPVSRVRDMGNRSF